MIKFGTSGFRAIIAEEFNKDNVQKIAQALAKIIQMDKSKHPVIVGYDRRFMSDRAAEWFTEVLAGNKIVTKLFPCTTPSPAIFYGVMKEGIDYGVVITASHNPYDYNGVKIVTKGGVDADKDFVARVEKIANASPKIKTLAVAEARQKGLVVEYDNTKDYFKNITKFISKTSKESKLKVIFNAMHGACSNYTQYIEKIFKPKVFTVVNDNEDPYFEHSLPAPEEEILENFRKQVVKGKYSVGFAVDGDGDRLAVIDEQGNFHNNNDLMAIAYYYLIKYRGFKGDVVKNCATSNILDKLAETFGFKCHETPVGFKYTSAKMKETDAILGGEMSGGMTMKNYIPSKDSFFSIAIILDAMATIKKPFSEIYNEVKESCGYFSTYINGDVKIPNKKKMEKALKKTSPTFSYKPKSKSNKDGVKFVFEDGSWVLIRFSGTENALRYYMEFATEIECERNLKAVMNFIDKYGK